MTQKFWLDPTGNLHPVPDSHEEWANQHGQELEDLLGQGWLRVQAVIPPYLYLDFHRPLSTAQTKAIGVLFQNQFDQVVIEYQGQASSFADGAAAWSYLLSLTA